MLTVLKLGNHIEKILQKKGLQFRLHGMKNENLSISENNFKLHKSENVISIIFDNINASITFHCFNNRNTEIIKFEIRDELIFYYGFIEKLIDNKGKN